MLPLAFFLYLVFAIAKLFVICSGVDVDCCSGEIEGDNIVSPSKNDSFGSAVASELQQVAEA